jgi:basic membrane protein A
MTIAALCVATGAAAAEPKLGIVYDAGGKFDKSFNQSAYEGAERFKKETGIKYIEARLPATPRPSRCCAAWRARSST